MNLRTFFKVTGMLLIVVAAGLLAFAVHELQEAGWLPFLTSTAYDVSGTLSDENGAGSILRAVIGYNDDPSALEVVVWLGYLLVAGYLFLRPHRANAKTSAALPTDASAASAPQSR